MTHKAHCDLREYLRNDEHGRVGVAVTARILMAQRGVQGPIRRYALVSEVT